MWCALCVGGCACTDVYGRQVIPFPQFEAQSRYVSQVWAGNIVLPPPAEMYQSINDELAHKLRAGVPTKYFHVQGGAMFGYNDELSALSGGPMTPEWRILMHNQCSRNKRTYPEDYRDLPLPTIEEYQAQIRNAKSTPEELPQVSK